MQYGFGCVLKPRRLTHSIYHNTTVLRRFESREQNSTHMKLGEWLESFDIQFDELTPVCDGSSFAVKASEIPLERKIFLSLTKNLEQNNTNEVSEFVERVWGGIFSYKIEKNLVKAFINHVDEAKMETDRYTGSLISYHSKPGSALWKGDTPRDDIDLSKLQISLVISFCDEDMSWMKDFIYDVPIFKTTIFSKFKSKVNYFPVSANVKVYDFFNVGRCDHTYAYYMNRIEELEARDNNHIILFLKRVEIFISQVLIRGP